MWQRERKTASNKINYIILKHIHTDKLEIPSIVIAYFILDVTMVTMVTHSGCYHGDATALNMAPAVGS